MFLRDLHKFILPEVLGCPDPLLDQAISQTAFEFFDRSGAWMEVSVEDLVLTESEYELPVVSGAIALRIRDAWINGQRLTPASMRMQVGLSFHSGGGQVFKLNQPVAGQITLRTVYAPSMTARAIPDSVGLRYSDAISSGTKARLMLMPAVGWSNPNLATYYANRFQSGIVDAFADAEHDHTLGSLSIVPRRFA